MLAGGRAEKQRLAKLYEAFRRVNASGSSLDQLVTIILKAVRNLVNSDHNLLLFVDNSRDQLWTKWTLGTVMDNKVSRITSFTALCSQGVVVVLHAHRKQERNEWLHDNKGMLEQLMMERANKSASM